jgi:hypothetical protein
MIGNNFKTGSFGQIQMIAKSLITICGIYLALWVIDYGGIGLSVTSCQTKIFNVFYAIAHLFVLSFVVFFMIVNNNWLIKKFLPDEEPIPAENQEKWFVSSLRIGLVFCGLMLLASSAESVADTAKIIAGLPFWGRQLLADIFYDGRFDWPQLFKNSSKIFRTALIAYLIIGAPQFVRWQMKRAFTQGEKNE